MSAFSPDGATVLILTPKFTPEGAMESVTVSQVQVADGKALYTEEPLPAVMEGPAYAFSPDSKQLVVAMPRMGLMLMNTDRSGEKTPLTMGPDMAPQFSPDGKTIFFLRDRKLFSVPVAGGEATPVAPNLMALDFCISPDGAQALVVGITEATLAALAPKPPAPKIPTGKFKAPTPAEIAAAKKLGTRTAVIKTVKGDITVELYGKDAPQTVANFVKLATAKFYNGLTFHRIVDGFCVQGGDPNGDGSGDPGYSIKLEIAKNLKHITGSLAMARSQDPDSAGCQFYITPAPQPALDGQYAVFGKVIKGMDVVKKIVKDDKIISITVK
jgi:peptidyl-prolyl cis-trans isomerase B (cyclophilin B)